VLAKRVEQRYPRLDRKYVAFSIDRKRDGERLKGALRSFLQVYRSPIG